MTLKTILVDDEVHITRSLQYLLKKYCSNVEVVATAKTVQDAIETIHVQSPDLVFLDVELPDGDGFNILEKFPKHHFNLVFVTAFNHYAIKAIKAYATDYILKPIDNNDLILAVSKVHQSCEKHEEEKRRADLLDNYQQRDCQKQKIAIPTMEGLQFIHKEDILYCEADQNYTRIFTAGNDKVLASRSLKYFDEILANDNFFRIHHSYLINLAHVNKYVKGKGGWIIMSNAAEVPVAVRNKSDFLEKFSK